MSEKARVAIVRKAFPVTTEEVEDMVRQAVELLGGLEGKVKKGDLVVMIGSGVGYNQAGVAFRMT
ncbi:MAG TPA: hypothetical protein PK545_04450 [Deltaproteobacteria bacterium]|nr:hypothetical protein [Deltaproteobacteria bacterium]